MVNWAEVMKEIRNGPCSGCPRNDSRMPVHIPYNGDPRKVKFLVISQEPSFSWRQKGHDLAQRTMADICRSAKEGTSAYQSAKDIDPIVRLVQIFDVFDPSIGPVYWTHALKCIPRTGDRDINKEWRKCAKACQEHFMSEVWSLGTESLNIVAVGKYALEMCLNALDGQDIDQELSISEFMQSNQLPLSFKLKSKDGKAKNITLFVYTNPSSEVCKVKKVGGKMTVDEIQQLQTRKIREMLGKK